MIGKPPEMVPDDLTGEEYYQLGSWYLELQKTELAREALNRAVAQHADLEAAKKSQVLLSTRVPAENIPKEALEACDKARMSGVSNPAEAASAYERLIAEHPKFERPYKRLAEIRLSEGNIDECIKLLEAALNINPNYAPAKDVMAQALAAKRSYVEATKFLEDAINSTPDAERQQLIDFRRSLAIVAALNP